MTPAMMGRWAALFAGAALLSGCAASRGSDVASASATASAPAVARDTGFVIIGDTGVLPPDGALKTTSAAVARHCAGQRDCSFMLLTGDNIYPKGASGDPAADAPVFRQLFVEPFAAFSSNNPASPIIVALGNHDWYTSRAGALAQVAFHEQTRPFFMQGLFFQRRVSDRDGGVEVFVIDTEMLLAAQSLHDYDTNDQGQRVRADGPDRPGGTTNALPTTVAEKGQLAWLERALAGSTARWKFIVAHHPLWQGRSDSKFEQSMRLRELLLPMACKYADAFFAGHQHTIEVHQDDCSTVSAGGKPLPPLPVIVSGAGAKAREADLSFARWQSTLFPQNRVLLSWGDQAGFVYASLAGERLTIDAIAVGSDGQETDTKSFSFAQRQD